MLDSNETEIFSRDFYKVNTSVRFPISINIGDAFFENYFYSGNYLRS